MEIYCYRKEKNQSKGQRGEKRRTCYFAINYNMLLDNELTLKFATNKC